VVKDTMTGIRIGDRTYEEGRQYRGFQLPQFLLQPQVYRGARVVFDITGKQLTITVANRQGTAMGQFAARGSAVGVEASGGIANDFQVKRVVEASQTRSSSGSRLLRGQATARQAFLFNGAYQQVKDGSGPLPQDTWQSLTLSEQNSSSMISFSGRELKPQLGPFAEAFAGAWWAPVV
jgi:hypothetical protein